MGYGVVKALDVMAEEPREEEAATTGNSARFTVPAADSRMDDHRMDDPRMDDMEARLVRIEKRLDALIALAPKPVEKPADPPVKTLEHLVTRSELDAAMDQLVANLQIDIERRFEVQNRSVQSLRTMVARTDELLEQVIENIESMGMPA